MLFCNVRMSGQRLRGLKYSPSVFFLTQDYTSRRSLRKLNFVPYNQRLSNNAGTRIQIPSAYATAIFWVYSGISTKVAGGQQWPVLK